MDYTTVLAKAAQTLEQRKDRSAWGRGVTAYAVDMLQQIADYYNAGYISADDLATWTTAEAVALNGARDWSEYSWGGSALVYDGDIAAALCTPSELKKDPQRRTQAEQPGRMARCASPGTGSGFPPRVFGDQGRPAGGAAMRKYKLKELRDLVRLGVAEDYTNKPSEYIYTLRRLEKVGYSSGVYGINGGLVEDTETGTLYAIIGRCSNLFILF